MNIFRFLGVYINPLNLLAIVHWVLTDGALPIGDMSHLISILILLRKMKTSNVKPLFAC